MANEPGFWSEEGFPYPLLALGQTFPRGYQYQSERTPYKRDARGDWGRALNESIDQFFGMWPQYMQQKRQFALQRDQLNRQRMSDKHQAKLRPFELKEAEAADKLRQQQMQMREDYPQQVKGLKVSDEIKSYLLTQTPEAGNKFLQTYYTHKAKAKGKTKFIKAGQPDSRGIIRRLDVQEKPDGTIIKAAVSPEKINIFPNEFFPGTKQKNTSGVTIEYNPADGSFSYPLDKPPTQDFITVGPGQKFPDGSINNSARDQLFDRRNNKKVAYEGTTPQKKIVPLSIHDRRADAFPAWQRPFLQLDMTHGGDGEVIVSDAAKTAPKNLVPVPTNDERLKNYYPDELAHLQLDKNNNQIVKDPGFTLREKIVNVPAGGLYPDGKTKNNLKVPVQVNRSGVATTPEGKAPQEEFVRVPEGDSRLNAYPEALHQYLHINKRNNQISFHPSFSREMQQLVLKEARPSATQRFSKWLKVPGNQVQSFADLEPWTGTSLESKLWFATQNLEPNHPLHIDAQNQLNLKHVKVTPNAVIVGRGYKDPSRPDEAKRLPEPTTEEILTGDTVSSLAERFGTTESQIIAANPDWFDKDMNGKANVLSMRTSEQMEDAEMIIPTGKSKLSQSQINEAHSSRRRARVSEMPYGTIIPIQTATVGDGLRLNTERLDMQNIQKSVKDFVELMQNPKARGFGKIGKKEKGELEGIRQRLINNVQVLRDYGVLSPSEITNIERSVPPVNSIIALMTRGLGSDQFVIGAMNKLYEEAVNRQRQLESLIKLYGAPITDYERYSGGVPGYDATSGGSEIEILDDELNSFGG